ncbi:Uma2 family endonuclease [Streptomyces venezuelae]|uniref:Uma2 family endonuclease n=1 Tax=Streptomyces venezuelae TaxID=54571 RepID=UPI0034268D69
MPTDDIYRHLRDIRDTLGKPAPMSWPEISGGRLITMTNPKLQHQHVAHHLRVQLEPQLDDSLALMLKTDLEDAALGILRIPDLVVIDEELLHSDAESIDPRRSHLVIEIVSRSTPANDYTGKLHDYPAMGIPHYLIVDPRDGTAVHHWAPSQRTGEAAYDNRQHYTFGDTITIDAWKIDTSTLPVYGAESGQ